MITNTKQTPKSCSCEQCRRGRASGCGNYMVKYDQRAYRHEAKIKLAKEEDPVLLTGPIGNYYD
jgi:hypothetical protein